MALVYTAEITGYDKVGATQRTLYYASGAGLRTGAGATPAHTTFDNRIVQPGLIRRDIFDLGQIGGASTIGYGELVLKNEDRVLDDILDYGLDGWDITIRVGDDSSAGVYPTGFTTIMRGTMEQPAGDRAELSIRLRDRHFIGTKPLNTNKYLGNNALPAGVEGLDSDLKGKPKPRLFGWCHNVEPVQVNTSRLVHQVNDGPIRDVIAVYDSGVLLTHAGDYTDQTDMETNAPAAGEYKVWKAGGMFRLGAAPYGQLTCDVVEGLTPMDRTAAAIFSALMTGPGGLTSGDLSASDLTTLDSQNPATIGLYYRDEVDIQTVADDIARSVGAWWGSDVTGTIRIKRLDEPTGPAVATIDGTINLTDGPTRVPLDGAGAGLPVYQVTVRGVPNYTVQTTGLAGAVSSSRRARLAQPFQDGIETDNTVKTAHKLSPPLTVITALSCLTAVQAEALRLLNMLKVKRDRLEVEVDLDDTVAMGLLSVLDLGIVVSLEDSFMGMDAGRLFRVIGYELNPREKRASLTLWG